jgi:hypothetical protein
MTDIPPLHPPAHPGQPAGDKIRRPRRQQRARQRGPHLTAHPLAKRRLKGHVGPGAASPLASKKDPP